MSTFLPLLAQGQTASLSGKVTDQTGAVIPQASVVVTGADGKQSTATTNQEGSFHVNSLAPGTYNVSAGANGFATLQKPGVELAAGEHQTLVLSLEVQAQQEKVDVQAEGTQLDVGAASNANALVIKGKDLEALSDDPDELQSELQALAGPAAGPNGGQIYIDGFTGGQLPPKSAIREIRINQDPFSAEYDKLGYGRIEILTKPGSDQLHGQFFFNDTNAIFNSKNPYVLTKPDYNSEMFDGNLGGPINKRASFFLDASLRRFNDFSAIYAINPADISGPRLQNSISNPWHRTSISPRIDYQLTANNTLTARYQLTHESEQNSGLGSFSLPSQAYNTNETEHTLQISDTQIFGPKIVNETRFQFQRETNHQLPQGFGPEVEVQGAFTFGESSQGLIRTTQDNYELQNYTSITHGNHLIKFGARLRGITSAESTNSNFNGTFVFSPVLSGGSIAATALDAYQSAAAGNCVSGPGYNPQFCPTQFSMAAGSPQVSVGWMDAGLYAEDEWRAKPNLSFTYGLRFESQNNIGDHADFAPRLGLAWGLGSNGKSAPKTVLRAGFGIFYDRFGYNLVQQADLLNGVIQQRVTIAKPDFFSTNGQALPSFSALQAMATAAPTIYQIAPNLRAPYTSQSAVSIERQITKAATVSVTYLNSRGEHSFYIDNVNAPYTPNGPRAHPDLYGSDNVYQYKSGGIYRENQIIANMRLNAGRRLSLFGFYTLSYAKSDTSSGGGAGGFFSSGTTTMASFLTSQFDPLADYGRAAFDVRHRAFIGGNVSLPYSFSLSPFVIITSGEPYNLTTGQDNNGDSIFNDRPWLANSGAVACSSRADFSLQPTSFGLVPVNDCTARANATFNLRLSKTIGFGRETKGGSGGGGGYHRHGGGLGGRGLSGGGGNPFSFGSSSNRRYNLTFSISARNLFNTFNPGPAVGNLSSPLFGQSIMIGGGPFGSSSSNRRIDLQVRFSF
ncbi:MAG TPA: carboxypeptidase regulatory-like domain-containing protein [Terriglobales bacterium]|nr:carboxypeptidase regulatory-like domain-containing protein [Terriglobales bacterium]